MTRSAMFLITLLAVAWSARALHKGFRAAPSAGWFGIQQSLPVPGVSVTAVAPVLQGTLSTTTDAAGGYVLLNLPPGDYQLTFELSGFAEVTQSTSVLLGLTVEQNVSIQPAGVAESVTVVAETPAPIATPVVGANLKHDEIERLATSRTVEGIAQLSPRLDRELAPTRCNW